MARISTLILSAATLAYLNLAPPQFREPLVELLSKSPVAAKTIFKLASIYAGFKLCTGLISNINSYFSHKKENNWVEDKYDWEKEVVLITGASSGLGEQIAIQLVEKGITIVALDVNPLPETLAKRATVHFYKCDISDFSALSATATEIRTAAHGPPTVIILNAGIVNLGPILRTPIARSQKLININLTANIALIHEFLPSLIEKNHGHVMFIASMCSYLSLSGMADYCASKAGLLAFYETLRVELRHVYKAPKVRTSIVHPTWMRTNIIEFDKVEKDPSISQRKRIFWPLDKSARIVVRAVLSGYGGRVLVPDAPVMRAIIGLRMAPKWFQEFVRDATRISIA
ncbi:hypothetical protein TWF694_005906 [Orbilia ellipsospora]|uniref:Uncharacterized protein n=1 Tax=Orbilia ellipsospora TaxID=2528407 RepID=A0AAV9WTW8_9PEZI